MNHDMNHHHDNSSNSSDHHMSMSMSMSFHTKIGDDVILFDGLKPTTTTEMIYACVAIFVFAAAYEGLKYVRALLNARQLRQSHYGESGYVKHLVNGLHCLQTILHGVQYIASYFLMLIAMTYQVYFFAAVIAGAAAGYLIFTPLQAKLKAKYENFGDICCG